MIEGGFHSTQGHQIVCSEDGCWSYRKRQERFGGLVTALHSGMAVLHILGKQDNTGCCQRRAESFQSEHVAWRLDNHGGTMVSQLQKMSCCQLTRVVKVDVYNGQGCILLIFRWYAEYQRLPTLSASSRSKHIRHRETPPHYQETIYPTTRK